MSIKTLTVELGSRSYPIYVGENLLGSSSIWSKHIIAKQVMLVSNETVGALYLEKVKTALENFQYDVILLPDGEQYKNLQIWQKIFDTLLAKKHRRNTTLIALGGGVVCDMTGFAAACYQRGVAFIQIPTSLLAQVDASIGGKTAINHPLGKNMIGAFHQPQAVIIDTAALATLPDREFYAGIAEIIKAALIADDEFFIWLEKNMSLLIQRESETLAFAIERACAIKARIVAADEQELTGERALLNLGHTFGHAIEQVLGYGVWLHGEAVATGTVLAATVSQQKGWLTAHDVDRIKKLLLAAHLPIQLPAEMQCDKMLAAMALDKKLQDANLKLVLLQNIGHAILTDEVDVRQVRQILEPV